jgi:iron complex outermembrane receptor protein
MPADRPDGQHATLGRGNRSTPPVSQEANMHILPSFTVAPLARRSLLVTTAILSPWLADALPGDTSWMTTMAHAQQAPTGLPPVTISAPQSRPANRANRTGGAGDASGEAASAEPAPLTGESATISNERARALGLSTSDSALLLTDIAGGAVWNAGGVSSLPAINGMGADRIQVSINGMLVSPACPNEMNPPLSFVNPAMIAQMRVYMGNAPVSVGGDYIGAKIDVTTAAPQFAAGPGVITNATIAGFFRSNGSAIGVDANAMAATKDANVSYTGGWVRAGNYTAADGTKVKSTLYELQNHALSLSKQSFGNLFTVQVGGQFIPYQGYVNQYMDMVYNRGVFANGRYDGAFDWGKLEATAFVHQIRHTMGFLVPDKDGTMPMDTKAQDSGYAVKATFAASAQDRIRIGNELHYNMLDDWWDPVANSMMMGPNTFLNINDGHRGRVGTFVEWERYWSRQWSTVVGVRNDTVWMNTGPVQGYNTMMYGADAAAFNAQDRARTDVNFDGSALVRFEPDQSSRYELGFARKTRSPNLYERYTWSSNAMAMYMIGWFGDGNGYIGNIDLQPEKANTVSFTAAWHDPQQKFWSVKVTPYYSYVQDYIDVDRCSLAGCIANLATNLTATKGFVFLQFANHDAKLYGVNVEGKLALWNTPEYGRGDLRGTLGYVHGERTDGIGLYHMMPINTKIALDHALGNWNSSLELQLVGAKNQISEVHNELTTPSYALLNFRTGYQWQTLRIDFGIDNLFNESYLLPLGGANLVNYQAPTMMGGSMPIWGYGVAGPGRSYNGRLTVKF